MKARVYSDDQKLSMSTDSLTALAEGIEDYVNEQEALADTNTVYFCVTPTIARVIATALRRYYEYKFSPEEVGMALVIHGQSDPKFEWGDIIKYSPSEVVEILNKYKSEHTIKNDEGDSKYDG